LTSRDKIEEVTLPVRESATTVASAFLGSSIWISPDTL